MRLPFRHSPPVEHHTIVPPHFSGPPGVPGKEIPGNEQDASHRAPQGGSQRWPFVIATATVSATVLLLEMTLTRFFSLLLNYHYVFVVLAVALLGIGLGATFCAVTIGEWRRHSLRPYTRPLWQTCLGSGVVLIVVIRLFTQTSLASIVPVAILLTFLPFFGAGIFLARVFTVQATRSRELYAADLLGAGVGCLLSLPALQWLGVEHTLALLALMLLAVAALLAFTTDRRAWLVAGLPCAFLGGMVGFMMASGMFAIQPFVVLQGHKHLSHILSMAPQAHIVDSRGSVLARTDVVAFTHRGHRQYAAFTDGGGATVLMPLPMTPAEWTKFDHDVGLFPYHTPPQKRVLIIGSGGGLDVLLALHGGAQEITAVEINADILRAVERFIPPTRNVYRAPNVHVVRGDGRQVIRQSTQLYDLIVLQQIYTGAAQRQGGSLVENYILTTEALQDYLAHLTPQGRVVVQVHDAMEALKTALMSLEALAQRGSTGPEALDHVLILQAASDTPEALLSIQAPVLVVKNSPYTTAESHQQMMLMQRMQLTPLFVPHLPAAGLLDGLLRSVVQLASQSGDLTATLRPATDDRPFFYETDTDLRNLIWLSLGVLFLLGTLHLWHYAQHRRRHDTGPATTVWLVFFAITGGAALLVQVALLQRYMLVLGAPTLTLIALLFPLLFFGGLGSLASTRLSDHMLFKGLPWGCVALGGLLVLYLMAFPVVRSALEPLSLLLRLLSTMILLAPLGLLMGLPFPVALRLLAPQAPLMMPWVWGVNAVACVVGSVVAMSLAVTWGLQTVVLLGALLYLLAGCWARWLLAKRGQFLGTHP